MQEYYKFSQFHDFTFTSWGVPDWNEPNIGNKESLTDSISIT